MRWGGISLPPTDRTPDLQRNDRCRQYREDREDQAGHVDRHRAGERRHHDDRDARHRRADSEGRGSHSVGKILRRHQRHKLERARSAHFAQEGCPSQVDAQAGADSEQQKQQRTRAEEQRSTLANAELRLAKQISELVARQLYAQNREGGKLREFLTRQRGSQHAERACASAMEGSSR